jgi:hypothetical protein
MEVMSKKLPVNLADMDRAFFETLDPAALVELTCRLHALAIEQAERLAQNSTNSSRPPSSDGPFGPPGGGAGLVSGSRTRSPQVAPSSLPATPSGRKPGKQPGAKGVWRSAPLEAEGTRNHYPAACAICGTVFELWDPNRGHSAHFVLDLELVGGGIRIACVTSITPRSAPAARSPRPGLAWACCPRYRGARAICC